MTHSYIITYRVERRAAHRRIVEDFRWSGNFTLVASRYEHGECWLRVECHYDDNEVGWEAGSLVGPDGEDMTIEEVRG